MASYQECRMGQMAGTGMFSPTSRFTEEELESEQEEVTCPGHMAH